MEQAGLQETKTKITEENKSKLRKLIRKLTWVSDQSRQDRNYEELVLSMAASAPADKDWAIIMATPPKYFGGWRGWTVDSAAQNLRNVFWEHPVIETSSGVVVVA